MADFVTWTTSAIDPKLPLTFRLDLQPQTSVYAGYDLYIGYTVMPLSGAFKSQGYFFPAYTIRDLPPTVTAHVMSLPNANPDNEKADNHLRNGKEAGGPSQGTLRLRTTKDTPPGTYTVTLVAQEGPWRRRARMARSASTARAAM